MEFFCNSLSKDITNYTDICNAFITCFSILIGLTFAYILFWQTNSSLKRKEALEKYNQLGDKLTLFRKLIFSFFNCNPWINERAISDYKYHLKNNMQDQMQEDITDNPFLNIYRVMNSIYDNIKVKDVYDNNYSPEYSLREINNLQSKANVIWYFIFECKDADDMIQNVDLKNCVSVDNSLIQSCFRQFSPQRLEKMDKYTIAHIAGDVECDIIPKMEIYAEKIKEKNPSQIRVIVCMLLISFVISVVFPIVFLLFEIQTSWVYLLLIVLLILPIFIIIQQIKKLVENEIKVKKGNG